MGEKSKFISGYVNHSNDDIYPLFIKLPKLNGSIKSFEKVKCRSLMVNEKYENILIEYSEVLGRSKELIRKISLLK